MKRSLLPAAAPVCVLREHAIVGESPLWHEEEKKLYWIDIQKRHLHRFTPSTGRNETRTLPEVVTSFAFRARGGVLLTLQKTFAFYDWKTDRLERLAMVEPRSKRNRFNDGKCDPAGNFWAGTMDPVNWQAPAGTLYRFDSKLKLAPMRTGVVCSNGCGWSPDGRTFYHTESFRYRIFAYDFDLQTSTLSRRRMFAEVDRKSGGFPDGMTVDAEGFIWSCQVGLGRIARYDPMGKIERYIELPVPRATDCTFGGKNLDVLYITSARETMTPAELRRAPLSGSLFAYHPGVRGQKERRFAG